MTQLRYITLFAFVIAVSLLSSAQAVLVETQSNSVTDGTITVAPGNNDRSDWNSIPSYQSDPSGDAGAIDYIGLQIAHDNNNIYFHLQLDTQASSQFLGFMHNMFLDTDLDRSTGYFGSSGFLSVGADYLIQGNGYFNFVGATQGAFSWNFLGGVAFDDFPTTDIELKIPRTALGNPDAFDIVLNAATSPTEDYYPNGATGGASGDYFRYTLVSVPEPSPVLLMLLVSVVIVSRGRLLRFHPLGPC